MSYLENFVQNGGQIISLGSVGVVWLALLALGGVAGGTGRLREIDHLIGWSLASLVITTAGVFLAIPFTYLGIGLGVFSVAAGVRLWRRGDGLGDRRLWRILLLAAPLLLLVSAMRGSQWDEFTDWLIIPRYMLDFDAFPSRENPFTKASFAGYPYSWHFISFYASKLAGHLLENAGALSNVFLLLAFGLLVVRLIEKGLQRSADAARVSWGLLALGGLAATLVNPTFAQKVALTAYADTSSAVVTGTAAVLAWLLIESLAEDDQGAARGHAWRLGLLLLLLVNLKQATLVLAVLIVGAVIIAGLRDPLVRFAKLARLLPLIVVPPLVIYLTWRYHLSNEMTVREFKVTAIDDWLIPLIPEILGRMALVLSKKGYYLALVLIIVGFGVRGLIRSRTPLDRFAVIAAAVVLGYNAFLLFAYVAAFGKFDALRAASYWRYNMHLGLVVVAFATYGAAVLWRQRLADRLNAGKLGWLPIILLLAAPFVFAKKLRFDRVPLIMHFRDVGAAVAERVRPGDSVFIADPTGSGDSAAIMSYELGSKATYGGTATAFDPNKIERVRSVAEVKGVTVIVVHSTIPEFDAILGHALKPGISYMLRRNPDGWSITDEWPYPKID